VLLWPLLVLLILGGVALCSAESRWRRWWVVNVVDGEYRFISPIDRVHRGRT